MQNSYFANREGVTGINRMNYNCINTPCYIINSSKLEENIKCILTAFKANWGDNFSIAYSIKTNHFPYLLKMSKEFGCIAEAVSNDEYLLAINEGFDPAEIIYNGPQKRGDTFLFAIQNGSIINIDRVHTGFHIRVRLPVRAKSMQGYAFFRNTVISYHDMF